MMLIPKPAYLLIFGALFSAEDQLADHLNQLSRILARMGDQKDKPKQTKT